MSAGNGMIYIWYSGYWETGMVRYLVGVCRQLYMYGSDMHLEYSHNCRNDFIYQTKMRSEQFINEFLAAKETPHKTPKNETGEFKESKHFQQNTIWHMTSWLAVAVYICINLCIPGQKMRFQHGHKCQSVPESLFSPSKVHNQKNYSWGRSYKTNHVQYQHNHATVQFLIAKQCQYKTT